MSSNRVVIAGGSGFLGRSLTRHLKALGFEVLVLSRSATEVEGARVVSWDGRSPGSWSALLDGASALVNLAGRSVDCIKTPDHCDEILRSRVESTRALGLAVRAADTPPATWVQMSTAHAYGDPPETVCTDDSAFGYGLAPTVAQAWEREFEAARPDGVRGVVLRASFVVGRDGGALTKLRGLVRLGLGGRVGSGRQGISWIAERDLNRVFERALLEPSMVGPYLVTAPDPVPQAEFMRTLRRVMGVPIGLPAFEWMVRLGAPLLLRTDPELALYGRYCVPKRLLDEGFEFELADLDEALREACRSS